MMCDLIAEIARADASEIEMLIKAVQRRYSELFPDWEVVMISLDKRENRHTQLNNIIQLLEKMKDSP